MGTAVKEDRQARASQTRRAKSHKHSVAGSGKRTGRRRVRSSALNACLLSRCHARYYVTVDGPAPPHEPVRDAVGFKHGRMAPTAGEPHKVAVADEVEKIASVCFVPTAAAWNAWGIHASGRGGRHGDRSNISRPCAPHAETIDARWCNGAPFARYANGSFLLLKSSMIAVATPAAQGLANHDRLLRHSWH
jgi:hypothetical protein